MDAPMDWLLAGEPWVEYRARLDLLGQDETDAQVVSARRAMLADGKVRTLVQELSAWPGTVISSHKSAGQPFHKLTFLADLGLRLGDPGIDLIVERILAHQSPEGPFQLPANIAEHYGGTGRETWGWALCDAPLIVYALVKMGAGGTPQVSRAVDHLSGLVRANGWPCAVSKELGNFHGPGRREDPCPFATLAMLKALSQVPEMQDSPACHAGAGSLLALWQESATRHPYIFYMGTDFRKLKVPFIWYDLLHVLDVLSHFPWLGQDGRFLEMLALLKAGMDPAGAFTLGSVWMAWKDWEFGQKKVPSRWLSLLAWRIIRRVERMPA